MKTTEVNYQDSTTAIPSIADNPILTNYFQVVENSHYFTDLEQILNYLKSYEYFDYTPLLREQLIIGIENTIKNGYKLTK